MNKILSAFLQVTSYLLMFGYWIFGSVSYVWAIVIAYKETGVIGSVVTLFLPVVGQIYWTYSEWSHSGFDSYFVLLTVGAVATYIASLIVIFLVALLSPKDK